MNKKELEIARKVGREFGSIGGKSTLKRHGKKHFSEAGRKGALKRWGIKLSTATPLDKDKGLATM